MKTVICFFVALVSAGVFSMANAATGVPNCEYLRDRESCMVCNVYHEARSETRAGWLAVAMVTLNRVESDQFPDTICEVVWQKHQFAWTNDGKSDRMTEYGVVQEIRQMTKRVLRAREWNTDHALVPFNRDTMWYHTTSVSPGWSQRLARIAKIGAHIFYSN